MGTFAGHAIPGSFFLLFSIWHAVDIYQRYFRSLRTGQQYHNSATVTRKNHRRLPADAILKLLATFIGFAAELLTAVESGRFVHFENGQHMTMYAFFALNGVADVVCHFKVQWVPRQLDYISSVLAFSVEGLLFMLHVHGRSSIDLQVHTLLTYTIAMCVLCSVLEMSFPNDVRPALARTGFTFLQGTWFWQVGQILYPVFGRNPWDAEKDHDQMLIVTMIFTSHLFSTVVFMVLLGAVVFRCCCSGDNSKEEKKKIIFVNGIKEYEMLGEEEQDVDTNCALSDDDDDDNIV